MRGYDLIGHYLDSAFDREMVVSAKSRFNRIEKCIADVFRNEGCKYWKLAGTGVKKR